MGTTWGAFAGAILVALRKRIGFLFQSSALFDSMTVKENVAFGLRMHTKMGEGEIAERVHVCLDAVRLAGIEAKMPVELSGGMKKRAALARAIAMQPDFILYDEPTTGLDPNTSSVVGDYILKLQSELDVTSVVVTHDMPLARRVSDHLALLYDGEAVVQGSLAEVEATGNAVFERFIQGQVGIMGNREREILLGAVIFFAVVILVVGTLWLSDRYAGAAGGYRLHVKFDRVPGLQVGNPVTFRGVRVGKVLAIFLDEGRPVAALGFSEVADLPVDSRFLLKSDGLLGGQMIEVHLGQSEQHLADGAVVHGISDSGLDAVVAQGEQTIEHLRGAIDSIASAGQSRASQQHARARRYHHSASQPPVERSKTRGR